MNAQFSAFDLRIDGVEFKGVLSPLSRALQEGIDAISLLDKDPANGDRLLHSLVAATKAEIESASVQINYIVAGAEPEYSSPMQYGGHFLELDRELIGTRKPAITVIGGPETYIDIISDLAETFLIWNPQTNPVDPAEVSKMTRAKIVTHATNFPKIGKGGVN